MTRRISTIVVLSLLAVVFVAMAAHAVNSPDKIPRVVNPLLLEKAFNYGALPYANENYTGPFDANASPPPGEHVSLGRASSSADPWKGAWIGDTWYDMQHNCRMTRMVDWGNDDRGEGFMVHFLWMRLASSVLENRHYAYNIYFAGGESHGQFLDAQVIQESGDYAGYVSLDVTDDGRGVLSGHNNQGSGYSPHTYWDLLPGVANFIFSNSRVPDTVMLAGTVDREAIWPAMRYQEHPTDPNQNVLHLFTQKTSPTGQITAEPIIYFRKVGFDTSGVWDYPPYIVDTVDVLAQDVSCANTGSGKVALVWSVNIPEPGEQASSHGYWSWTQWNNDIWYQISNNYGASWEPRVNLTQNVEGEEGYRAYGDLQSLITEDNDLHIVWHSRIWPADAEEGGAVLRWQTRMFHWGENVTCGRRTIVNLDWDSEDCYPPVWNITAGKMSISECNGKLYCIWTQYNDVPFGLDGDCHARAVTLPVGAANGELYLSVSDDYGLTWDTRRNLTNTHTPLCDPDPMEPGGPCRSENYASMNRHGTDLTGNMVQAVVIDPSGGYTGDYFLDVQYIGDEDPGTPLQELDNTTWQNNSVMWFRLACVEPITTSSFTPSWTKIDFPEHAKHGEDYNKEWTIENGGNALTTFTLALTEDPGPYSGWLTVSAELQGSIEVPYGCDNTITGTVTINGDLAINDPGTIVHLSGNMTATGNMTPATVVIPIDFWVVDTLIPPVYDTITTGCFKLVVGNSGNWGNMAGSSNPGGHVNLDFFDYGDCDDLEGLEDTIPGNSNNYVFDASPIICWTDVNDTVRCNWSFFGSYVDDDAFFPWSHIPVVNMVDFELYQSEFVTRDTGILFKKLWIAPYNQGPPDQGCNFIIQVLKVMRHPLANGDEIFDNLTIGEGIDWDIPSDSGSRNLSGFEYDHRLIWQQGQDYEPDAAQCQRNENRYGGIALLDIVEIEGNDTLTFTDGEVAEQYGVFTEDNDTWVYPNEGFVPEEMLTNMTDYEGYNKETDSLDNDLHSVMTFRSNYTLTPTGKLIIFKCLITCRIDYATFIANVEACQAWYLDHLVPKVTGACCLYDGSCVVISEQACTDAGGTYNGDDTDCESVECAGACCYYDGSCVNTSEQACIDEGGTFNGLGTDCATTDCSGACCVGVEGEDCVILSAAACAVAEGTYKGGGVSCDPNPCLGCCMPPIRGNVNYGGDDAIDISDLIYLVDYMFSGGSEPQCFEEADMNGDGGIDISDLIYLVDYMFSGGALPHDCP